MRLNKKLLNALLDAKPWLTLLLLTDGVFIFFMWLADPDAFHVLVWLMLSVSLLLFILAIFGVWKREIRLDKAWNQFLMKPDESNEKTLCQLAPKGSRQHIHEIETTLRDFKKVCNEQKALVLDYEDFIEAWVHEIKTPLSLVTLILDNRKDEMSPLVYQRIEYARNQTQEDVEQILYYARLKSTHKDYLFERVSLRQCCIDAVSEYKTFLEEQGFNISIQVSEEMVVTDRKGLDFMLRQIISNSVKYMKEANESPYIMFLSQPSINNNFSFLTVRDNGMGVKASDLPFIFDKGFTGDIDEHRKKATGIGLYLVKQMANDLNISLDVSSEYGNGFEIIMKFPVVND